jgi:hypothetical protein
MIAQLPDIKHHKAVPSHLNDSLLAKLLQAARPHFPN